MFNLPLILDALSFYNDIYSALKVTHGISTWASEEGTKTISADLVLYKKLYTLVNGRADFQFMFVLRLGFCIFKSYWDFCSIIWHRLSLDEIKMVSREYRETSIYMLCNTSGTRLSERYLSGCVPYLHPKFVDMSSMYVEEKKTVCLLSLNIRLSVSSTYTKKRQNRERIKKLGLNFVF